VVRVAGSTGSFLIDNLDSDRDRACRFELQGPAVETNTLFTRYGEKDAGRVQIHAISPGRVRVDYPIPARSYGLISVEPQVEPPADPAAFEFEGLSYSVAAGAFLRIDQGQPRVRSLGPDTRIEVRNPTPDPRPVRFLVDNCSDRLSEPFLSGLAGGRLARQGKLAMQVTGQLSPGAMAVLALEPRPLSRPWSFIVGGDIKAELGIFLSLIEQVQLEHDPLFLVATGDYTRNSLPHELEAYFSRTETLPFPTYPVKANHEIRAQGQRHYPRMFGPAHYAVRVGGVLVAVIDATDYQERAGKMGFVIPEAQLTWLDTTLRANRALEYRMVALHPPPHPLHGESLRPEYPANLHPDDSARLRALAAEHQVRYVLSGHAHLFARKVEHGTVYLTSGGGGAKLYSYQRIAGFEIQTDHHLVVLQVGATSIDEHIVHLPRPVKP